MFYWRVQYNSFWTHWKCDIESSSSWVLGLLLWNWGEIIVVVDNNKNVWAMAMCECYKDVDRSAAAAWRHRHSTVWRHPDKPPEDGVWESMCDWFSWSHGGRDVGFFQLNCKINAKWVELKLARAFSVACLCVFVSERQWVTLSHTAPAVAITAPEPPWQPLMEILLSWLQIHFHDRSCSCQGRARGTQTVSGNGTF